MGNEWGFLDQSTVSWLSWLWKIAVFEPDLAVHESVPEIRPEWLQNGLDALGCNYQGHTVVFTPADIGIPMQRRRRYSIAVNVSKVRLEGE